VARLLDHHHRTARAGMQISVRHSHNEEMGEGTDVDACH